MAIERTFSIIKPDAVERNKIGEITAMLESAGLRIVASKRIKLSQEKAAQFYGVHKDRPFFQSLCDFMCSGPIIVQVLEGENAVQKNRDVMGATNPEEAAEGTAAPSAPHHEDHVEAAAEQWRQVAGQSIRTRARHDSPTPVRSARRIRRH